MQRSAEMPIATPGVKAPIEPTRAPARASQVSSEEVRSDESRGKRGYLLIGLVAAAILGGAGYLLMEKSSPTVTSAGTTEEPAPAALPNTSSNSAAKDSGAAGAVKLLETAEVLKLVMSMVDTVRAKDEPGLQRAFEAIKQIPAPPRGDRAIARAANTAGLAKLQANDPEGAISSFREGLAADPSDVEIVNNLGYAISLAGKEIDAIEMLARAITLAPDRSSAWANLAVSLAKTNQLEKGVAAYLIAYRFSKNQDKLKNFITKQSEEASDERERDLSLRVLKEVALVDTEAPAPKATVN
jgi:Flp pilus assembly protein TadD